MAATAPPARRQPTEPSGQGTIREPVMRVTGYDRLSSWMIAVVFGLVIGVACIVVWWATTRPEREEFLVPLEMVELSGGSEDGAPDETLSIESPEDPNDNPSPSDEILEPSELTEMVDSVVELADQATQQAQQVAVAQPAGTPGSAVGSGRRGLGTGPGEGGIPNEQRWFISYADESSITEYAKQLDHFGIELGALLPGGQLVYLSNVSAAAPMKRTATSGAGESRLYMTWQGGSRKSADVQLFQKVGVDVSKAVLFHFYPKRTEQLLLTQEFQYAKRGASEIRRTYFVVVKQGSGYQFVVTRQTYLR